MAESEWIESWISAYFSLVQVAEMEENWSSTLPVNIFAVEEIYFVSVVMGRVKVAKETRLDMHFSPLCGGWTAIEDKEIFKT